MRNSRRSSSDTDSTIPPSSDLRATRCPVTPSRTDPGDAVVFNQSLYHAVYGKAGRRRYVALKYAARPTSDAHLESIKRLSPYALDPHERIMQSKSPRLRTMTAGIDDLKVRAGSDLSL